MKITEQQTQLSKVLRKGAQTTVLVTYDGDSVTPYYKAIFLETSGLFILTLLNSHLLRLSSINFLTNEVSFLIFKDVADELIESNSQYLTDEK